MALLHEVRTAPPSGNSASALAHLLDAPPQFVELLPVAAYACDATGRLLWFNRLAASLWGRSPRLGEDSERFCGSHRLYFDGRLISPDETPMANVLRTGEAVQGAEGIIERPDGSQVRVMVHILPVKDPAGTIVGAINCFHDTTELHRTNQELQAYHDDLEDFFDNGAVALHMVSSDGIVLRANKAELDLLGYSADEYVGRPVTDFHADSETIAEILSRLGRGEKLERYPARLRAKDGSIRHVLITSSPRLRDGSLVNTRCFTVDVTAEEHAKIQAQVAEERYKQVLEALPAAVYTTDAEGRITYFNQAAVEMSGREPELGSDKWCVTWRLYLPDGTLLPHDECPMAIALKENRPIRNVEAVAERPDGTLVPFLPYPTPLRDRNGELAGAVNMLVDISDRKQAEFRQVVLLKELNHRVKNNMQMLQALLSSAQRETSNFEARTVLADATRRVAAMAAAQQVLYEENQPTEFSAREFVQSVCSTAQATFSSETDITLADASGLLSNDIAMPLALILNELLTNAAKHAAAQKGAPIQVGLSENGDGTYRLWVQDSGPGFELSKIKSKRASGLGLVTGLARQLGGSLRVEQAGGAKCIVTFRQRGRNIDGLDGTSASRS